MRHRGAFSYIDGLLPDGTTLKAVPAGLCRLSPQLALRDLLAQPRRLRRIVFPTGLPISTCEDALDTACGLYLNDPTAWT